jgi:antitoxin (DNA-binding transcriptional repressor) of toxin-antitoxin stability system
LEYLRQIEASGEGIVVTDRGTPVVMVMPYAREVPRGLAALRGSVLRYDDPLEPVGVEDWEALR